MKRVTIALAVLVALSLGLFAAINEASAYSQRGVASYYCCQFNGRATANGERFNQNAMTAAHKSLPFGTRVRVTNLRTGRSIVVRINDRGPYVGGRIIDLSRGAARALGMGGTASVRVDVVGGGKRTLVAGKRVKSKQQVASRRTKAGKFVKVVSVTRSKVTRVASMKKRVAKYATGFVKKKKPAYQPIVDIESDDSEE